MKSYFYGKQDYSEEGQELKTKAIEASIDRRVKKQMANRVEPFNFKLICEESSFLRRLLIVIGWDKNK